jgi:CRISPR-associated protein Cas1
MPTLYLLEPNTRLEKEYGRLLVTQDDEVLLRVPIKNVSGVVLVGYAGATTQALHALLKQGAPLFIVARSGELLGRLAPPTAFNLPLRQAQYRRDDEAEFILKLALQIVTAKIHNQMILVQRIARRKKCAFGDVIERLKDSEKAASICTQMDSLLGIEGSAAKFYFEVFQKAFDPAWEFTRRTRRPPKDAINALLSLGYTILGYAAQSALEIVGLDPYLGYFHQEAYGRPALALDLVEEFRAPLVDSLVMGLINRRLLKMDDFEKLPQENSKGVYLTRGGMRIFVREFEDRLESTVTPRSIGRPLSYRKLLEVQARRLANVILGKESVYQPFRAR